MFTCHKIQLAYLNVPSVEGLYTLVNVLLIIFKFKWTLFIHVTFEGTEKVLCMYTYGSAV
jgi:hypothetical protein